MLASVSAALLVAVLTVFHVVLLWQRVLDLSLFKPVPAVRWLATAFLLVVLYRLHRSGVSLTRGRSAVVFWLLVLLLHASFWGPLGEPSSTCAGWTGSGWLLALPAITVVLGLVFPTIKRLLVRVLRSAEFRDPPVAPVFQESQRFVLQAGFLPVLSCRPPPAFSQ